MLVVQELFISSGRVVHLNSVILEIHSLQGDILVYKVRSSEVITYISINNRLDTANLQRIACLKITCE